MEDSGYSELVVPRFRRAAKELGVAIVGSAGWDPDAKSYDRLVERVARARPDGVLIGDPVFQNAGAVIKALRARFGAELALISGEGTFVEALTAAGPAAKGMYITNTAAANEGLGPAGRRFLREFSETQPGREVPSMSYVPEAAQAAEALLEAIARSDGTRASVNRELRRLTVENGILGSFRFDRNGDVTPTAFTIFRGTGEKGHAPNLTESFAGSAFDRVVHVPAALVAKQ
jgi:branched-chain amino acid transport system substrate-binding protein